MHTTNESPVMTSRPTDELYYRTHRRMAPILAGMGLLFALFTFVPVTGGDAILRAGMGLLAAECWIGAYYLYRSGRDRSPLPAGARWVIFIISGIAVLTMVLSMLN